MHEVLVNRLGGLSLPRKSVVRLTDRPVMTIDVYRGRKTIMQQQQIVSAIFFPLICFFPSEDFPSNIFHLAAGVVPFGFNKSLNVHNLSADYIMLGPLGPLSLMWVV